MYVPVQLERLMWIGTLLCLTSFLVRRLFTNKLIYSWPAAR